MDPKPFILIVDDIARNLQIIGKILQQGGYEFTPAISGEQALKIVEKKPPDLILLDIMMPEMDGYEVCRILKGNPSTSSIPIIFLTAKTDANHIITGFEMGAVDYITKPFHSKELLARIRTHLEIIRIQHEQRELLHLLCHDLANMFQPILSGLDVIHSFEMFQRLKPHLKISAQNGMRLIELVREMRTLQEKKRHLTLEPVDLKHAITMALNMLKEKFVEKQVEPVVEIEANQMVMAEKTSMVTSVINNILTNAIKFSYPNSKILIRSEAQADEIVLSIKDFGIGMPDQIKKNLFNITRNTTRKGTNGEKGTGFGMPLIKKFINTYGGSIHIETADEQENPSNHGTEVIIRLKRADSSFSGVSP